MAYKVTKPVRRLSATLIIRTIISIRIMVSILDIFYYDEGKQNQKFNYFNFSAHPLASSLPAAEPAT